jgi:Ca2+ transporting ATPase
MQKIYQLCPDNSLKLKVIISAFFSAQIRRQMPEANMTKVFTFNSARKSMSTVVPLEGGNYRVFTKGASEIITRMCSFILGEGGKVESFTTAQQDRLVQNVIEPMAKDGLRTISIAYRDFMPNMNEYGTGKLGIF